MREFKFIRGKLTNENIFNTDEISDCLFAYDKNGNLISFDEQNDEDFQEKFVGLSPDRLSEIYTLRPSQFTISAKQNGDGDYEYSFTANTKVFDGSRDFPESVIAAANKYIKDNTSAAAFGTGLPVLNFDDSAQINATTTTFTFNNKTFTRDLVFKVSGYLNERGYVAANGEDISAYTTTDGKINYDDNTVEGPFYNGHLQKSVDTVEKIVILDTLTVNESNIGGLDVASQYTPDSGYAFLYDNQFVDEVNYEDSLEFDLYKEISEYLVVAEETDAVTTDTVDGATTYTLNEGYVAYAKDKELTQISLYNDSDSSTTKYEVATGNVTSGITSTEDYTFYRKVELVATIEYERIASSKIDDRNGAIVKGYGASYSGSFILDDGSLRVVEESDLTGESINVYTSDNYHIVGDGVYEDASDDYYVMFNDNSWITDVVINSSNTYINDNNIPAPIITNDTFRLITSVEVNATQSY